VEGCAASPTQSDPAGGTLASRRAGRLGELDHGREPPRPGHDGPRPPPGRLL